MRELPVEIRVFILGHDYGLFTRDSLPGKYPCECWYKDNYPEAFVYVREDGHWVTSQQLEFKSRGRAEVVR